MTAPGTALADRGLALPASGRRAWTRALIVLGLGLAGLFALFHEEAAAALKVWLASTAFGHCFLVAPIAVWLAWERRGALAGLTPAPVPALALLGVLPVGAWFLAERLGIMEGRQFAALFLAWLLTLSVLGLAIGRAMAVPLLYTIFLVPFGAFLVPALQDFTVRFIDVGLTLLDVPHMVTATLIEIPEGDFRVVEACAGLRFLIAAIAFGTLYACVIYRSAWRRAAFIAVCIVVPVLANGVRALGIVMLGHIEGSAEAGAVDHVLYGWIFFTMVMLLLILLGLPFREDQAAAPAPRAAPPPRRSPALVAMMAVLAVAAAGPAASSWLDRRADADTADAMGLAARLAARLMAPPGCVAGPVEQDARDFDCNGIRIAMRIRVFSERAGPAVMRAWRAATDPGSAEDSEATWHETTDARWRVVETRDPASILAAALWLDGAPAPQGLALRLRLARGAFAPEGGRPVGTGRDGEQFARCHRRGGCPDPNADGIARRRDVVTAARRAFVRAAPHDVRGGGSRRP